MSAARKNGVTLFIRPVNERLRYVMEKGRIVDMIGRDHFCPMRRAVIVDEVL